MLPLRQQRRIGRLIRVMIELMLLITLAWILAKIFWLLIAGQAATTISDGITIPRFSNETNNVLGRTINTNLLLEKNYFQPTGEITQNDEIPETRLNLKLKGVRAGAEDTKPMAIIRTSNNRDATYSVGDEIQNGVVLSKVLNDRVILDKRGISEVLVMPGASTILLKKSSVDAPPPEPVPTAPIEDEAVVKLPPSIVSALRFEVLDANRGIQIFPRNPEGGNLDALNLKSGDILVSINGTPKDSLRPQDFFQAFMSNQVFSVKIDRNGKELSLRMKREQGN